MDELPPSPYSDADIAALCSDLRLDAISSSKDLAHGLRVAAHLWERHHNAPTEIIRPKALRDDLIALVDTLDAATAVLQDLTDAQWDLMRRGCALFNSDPYKSRIEQRADTNDTHAITKAVTLVTPDQETQLTVQSINQALNVLSEAALYGASVITDANKRGPQEDFPLKAWMREIHYLCSAKLRIPFTCDESRGTPISAAACFCVRAYKVLSPETESKRFLTAMKKDISLQAKSSREFVQNRV